MFFRHVVYVPNLLCISSKTILCLFLLLINYHQRSWTWVREKKVSRMFSCDKWRHESTS